MVIGVDIGGTKIYAGLVDALGRVRKRVKLPSAAKRGRAATLGNLTRAIEAVWVPGVRGIGVGFAGHVDHERGIVFQSPNFSRSFMRVPVRTFLARTFNVRVVVDNDAHCFALAEATVGAGKKYRSVVGITLGTGIGGGIVLDKTLYRGRNNSSGEVGHMTITSEGGCSCGQIGHFESLVSGGALTRLYRKETGRSLESAAIEELAQRPGTARELLQRMGRMFGVGLANIATVLNPDVIVVGGGFARVRALWGPAKTEFRRRVPFGALRGTPIVPAALGEDAAIVGAALLLDPIHKT
ncbi:MAG: ROK family protein [Patescibacteria group bacterium]